VAVIGSGPAGLTAAFYLRKRGYSVSIFEARSKTGGMMRYGIPRYRLPDDLLDKEIGEILSLGIQFKPNQVLRKTSRWRRSRKRDFVRCFAVGAQLSRRIPLKVIHRMSCGVDFLARVAEGERAQLPEKVIVIGGGNGCGRRLTARRCGAKDVTMILRGDSRDAPSMGNRGAIKGGSDSFHPGDPIRSRDHGRITGMEIIHGVSVSNDPCVFNPKFDETRKLIEADQVILAIGQASDLSFLQEESHRRETEPHRGRRSDPRNRHERVFAGGDVAAGPGPSSRPLRRRIAASSIDKASVDPGTLKKCFLKEECQALTLEGNRPSLPGRG
jgi:NADPH-dependent glutamate synthase beta subunit-like oxidoreductase